MNLPEYEHPPVTEVVLGVHFKPLEGFGSPHIGLLWREFRQQFGKVQEQGPLSIPLERFGIPETPEPPATFELLDKIPPPRIWFVNEAETELLQIQYDWFSHNWRKLSDHDEYPRYEKIRASFSGELNKLIEFMQREGLGALAPLQCEVTYVNHIPMTNGETLEDILTVFRAAYSDGFLGNPEDARLSLRFVFRADEAPLGRLHIGAVPIILVKKRLTGYRLTLTARGKPAGETTNDIFAFFDMGHEWIVRGFTSVTTSKMHDRWGRTR